MVTDSTSATRAFLHMPHFFMCRTSLTLRWPAQRLQSGDAVVGSLDSLGGHMDCGGGILILVAHTGVKGDAGEQRAVVSPGRMALLQ